MLENNQVLTATAILSSLLLSPFLSQLLCEPDTWMFQIAQLPPMVLLSHIELDNSQIRCLWTLFKAISAKEVKARELWMQLVRNLNEFY